MSSLVGLLLYERLFSPPLVPLLDRAAAGISIIWISGADRLKKIQENAKKLFQNLRE